MLLKREIMYMLPKLMGRCEIINYHNNGRRSYPPSETQALWNGTLVSEANVVLKGGVVRQPPSVSRFGLQVLQYA